MWLTFLLGCMFFMLYLIHLDIFILLEINWRLIVVYWDCWPSCALGFRNLCLEMIFFIMLIYCTFTSLLYCFSFKLLSCMHVFFYWCNLNNFWRVLRGCFFRLGLIKSDVTFINVSWILNKLTRLIVLCFIELQNLYVFLI